MNLLNQSRRIYAINVIPTDLKAALCLYTGHYSVFELLHAFVSIFNFLIREVRSEPVLPQSNCRRLNEVVKCVEGDAEVKEEVGARVEGKDDGRFH